jgi:gamma-glutamylcyclotransferase (GGCT)/AIG2-like uncharacterized protein YtfP
MRAVTGQTYHGVNARLPGYAIYRVKDAEYPGIIDSFGNEASGVLYRGVNDEDLMVLDLFEGELYERRLLAVISEDGKTNQAWVYVISENHKAILTTEPWKLTTFLEKGFDTFMKNYVNGRKEIYMKK